MYTNDRLKNYAIEYIVKQEEKYIDEATKTVEAAILEKAYADSPGCEYPIVYYDNKYTLRLKLPIGNHCHRCVFQRNMNRYTSTILERIAKIFPEMKIQVDPLQTYVLFDWS